MAKWKEYKVNVETEDIELLSDLFIELGSNGVSIADPNDALPHPELDEMWSVSLDNFPESGALITAYLPEDKELAEKESILFNTMQEFLESGKIKKEYKFETQTLDDDDWLHEWEKYYQPIQLTDKIEIIPIWKKEEKLSEAEEKLQIFLDPGLAFGTGDHPTTQLCAQILADYLEPGEKVYDVGTGSGILAIIAAKLGAKSVDAYDFDIQAVDSSKYNASLNELNSVIDFDQKDLLSGVTKPADIIVANILEPIIIRLIPAIPPLLKENGRFIISGILEDQIPNIESHLTDYELKIKEMRKNGDWVALVVTK